MEGGKAGSERPRTRQRNLPKPGSPPRASRCAAGDHRARTKPEGYVPTTTVYGEGGTSLVKYCKVTLDRLPLRDFSKDGRREHSKQDVFPDSKFWGRTPKTLPGKSFLVPKLLPLRTEKCVQKAFPLHRNLIMAWLHLLGFIHFYCSFHCPLFPDVFKKPESNQSGEGVLGLGHLRLGAAVRGGQ